MKDKWSWAGRRKPDARERKLMLALLLREVVRVTITSHLYQFGGRLYLQRRGGPIGLRLTEALVRAVTQKFSREFKKAPNKLELELLLNKLYADDLNAAAEPVGKYVKLNQENGNLFLSTTPLSMPLPPDWDQEAHTAALFRDIANSVMPNSIVMVEDTASRHGNKKLPILDMEMWMEKEKIIHQFYAKPMTSKSVISARSAFTLKEKKNILLEEGSRRLRNCQPVLPWSKKAAYLTDLNLAMRKAGHGQDFRAMITVRTVAKYCNSLKNHRSGRKAMYRSKKEREEQRKKEGGKATAATWMRKGGATAVFKVSATKESKLATAVEEALSNCPAPSGTRTKVQERPGRSLKTP